jgi:hypothetical protein
VNHHLVVLCAACIKALCGEWRYDMVSGVCDKCDRCGKKFGENDLYEFFYKEAIDKAEVRQRFLRALLLRPKL